MSLIGDRLIVISFSFLFNQSKNIFQVVGVAFATLAVKIIFNCIPMTPTFYFGFYTRLKVRRYPKILLFKLIQKMMLPNLILKNSPNSKKTRKLNGFCFYSVAPLMSEN